MNRILIANRGEVAIRIAQAVAELGLHSVAMYSEDDAQSLHIRRTDQSVPLAAKGARAYLDGEAIIAAAIANQCDAIHPGYGFLSENAAFAAAAEKAGITFIGPDSATLAELGNKTRALELARSLGINTLAGLDSSADHGAIAQFMSDNNGAAVILKAVAGGGGRGMRIVHSADDIETELASAQQEALAAFGSGDVFVERFVPHARHIEVQIIGDGNTAIHAWERDCTLQRRHQKIIEIAPAPALDIDIRNQLLSDSLTIANAVQYRGLGTFEFLLDKNGEHFFIEANPRLQVEHTITEAITGIDLVQTQIRILGGETLADLGLEQTAVPAPVGTAVQCRVNLEVMTATGDAKPTGGTLSAYEQPGGAGVRVDGHGYTGLRTSAAFDSLLAKVICHSTASLDDALARSRRALRGFRIEGVATNIPYLHALLDLPEISNGTLYTRLIEDRATELFDKSATAPAALTPQTQAAPADGHTANSTSRSATIKSDDPLGILHFARDQQAPTPLASDDQPGAVSAAMQGTIVSVEISEGQHVSRGDKLFVMEAMKMQHSITADTASIVATISVAADDSVYEGDLLAVLHATGEQESEKHTEQQIDLDYIRPDLAELQQRQSYTTDTARPDAVAKRHKLNKRTARENIAQLCDPETFVEYGDLAIAAQRSRRSVDDLIRNTPADGLITGFASINGEHFSAQTARCAVMHYDYTVLAGTQGIMNHTKKDRMLAVIERQQTPLIFFCEGGGGRPGDVDASDTSIAGLYTTAFYQHARLSGLVPMIGIGSGRLFAGNAALLGCCDVVIATRDSSIGMGGPAMIEGGGLGIFKPEEVGPSSVQSANGVIDVLVEDEVEAVEVAKKYLGYFQGPIENWSATDARYLRHVVPENRLEVYDVKDAIKGIADIDSILELRADFAAGMVTAFIRVSGRSVGVLANNPLHLAGAIDSPGADKAARFIKLCDSFDIPLLTLCDTPGMMVGPDIEKTALVRHCCRLFLVGANIRIPLFTIVLRKAYGLGAQAMAGGSFRTPDFIVSWPTGEIGGMGLEGAVKLGYRKELEAIEDLDERRALYEKMVANSYQRGKAINAASVLEFDTVIDPADSRKWIIAGLDAAATPAPRNGKKRAFVDSW